MKRFFAVSQILILPIMGILIINKPVHYSYKFAYDLRGGLQWVVGGAFIAIGIFFFIAELKRSATKVDDLRFPVICPKCQEVFGHLGEISRKNCPHCNVAVENLKGFYERHPDLKSN